MRCRCSERPGGSGSWECAEQRRCGQALGHDGQWTHYTWYEGTRRAHRAARRLPQPRQTTCAAFRAAGAGMKSSSAALRMFGDGDWHVHKHKTTNKRQSWRKLHLGIDGSGCIIASALTDSGEDDAYVGISMLEQIEGTIGQFAGDGAYDSRPMYEALTASGTVDTRIVIPPKTTATVDSRTPRHGRRATRLLPAAAGAQERVLEPAHHPAFRGSPVT